MKHIRPIETVIRHPSEREIAYRELERVARRDALASVRRQMDREPWALRIVRECAADIGEIWRQAERRAFRRGQ